MIGFQLLMEMNAAKFSLSFMNIKEAIRALECVWLNELVKVEAKRISIWMSLTTEGKWKGKQ
jgi:hypothetical protein